ncbi:MAG: putative DNA binding domain-containing protein [Fimbriimonadales bacterium]|nr:putative DNA binding domain-containing protein [Fimbriimonadales bacterium]
MLTEEQILDLVRSPEGRCVEFKEARQRVDWEDVAKYCVAIANEGGGYLILGVSDRRPRQIVGTMALPEPGETESLIYRQIGHRVQVQESFVGDKRVVVITVPPRPVGTALSFKGAYYMRAGDSLVPMDDNQLRAIHHELPTDFSAQTCPEATLEDLDPNAVELFRQQWLRKSGNRSLETKTPEQLLSDAELLCDGKPTYAALVLMGRSESLARLLPQAEIVYEYRDTEAPGPASVRREYRRGFLCITDELWNEINLRNKTESFQEGFFVVSIPTFDERVVREVILNAVAHRDYRLGGSIFVVQYPNRLEVRSPGGFPPGVSPENILWEQNPRNRRIAEAFTRCGLVERAGQGYDIIYQTCIEQGKPLPDFSRSTGSSVSVSLSGQIRNVDFLRFLRALDEVRRAQLAVEDFLLLDCIYSQEPIPERLKSRVERLVEAGIVERFGRGRGVRYILARGLYQAPGKAGIYTRQRGLDRSTHKALLLQHIRGVSSRGARFEELQQVLPHLSRNQVQSLLRELKRDGKIRVEGTTRAARWYPQ